MEIITLDNSKTWDEIVVSFANHDVYYYSGYVKSFEIHGDGMPLLFYYEDKGLRGITVMMKRDISEVSFFSDILDEKKMFDVVSPYGYGGFIFEGTVEPNSIRKCYEKFLKKMADENIISAFVRYHPELDNANLLRNDSTIIDLGSTISIDLTDKEQIWNNFTSKNRNTIRKAQKNNISIKHAKGVELFDKFIEIYNETMRIDNADNYYYFNKEFYYSIHKFLFNHYEIFYAEYENEIIAISIILFANEKVHYHLSGSNVAYRHLAPSNLLLYEVACWGHENRFKSFHLGGGLGSAEDGLFKFKSAFNRQKRNQFSIGKDIVDIKKYNELVKFRKEKDATFDENINFFPLYRNK